MPNILIATMGFTGHVTAALPLARKLVERGNQVGWYTGQKFQAKVEATGAKFARMETGRDFDDFRLEDTFPEQAVLSGVASMKSFIKNVVVDTMLGYMQDLTTLVRDVRPDVILVDHLFPTVMPLYARTRIPWATFSVSPLTIPSRDTAPDSLALFPNASFLGRMRNHALYYLFNKIILRDVNDYCNRQMVRLGAPPLVQGVFAATVSPFLYLQPTVEAFEYPRSDLPPQVHFIGPFLPGPSRDFAPPTWWPEMIDYRGAVVHVTQGTLTTEPDQLIVPTIQALAGEDIMLIATTGGHDLKAIMPGALPPNTKVEPYLPHFHLLPRVSAMVTNGGYGGVQIALANGVPLVVAGMTEDKREVANRVSWSGTGINLRTNTPKVERLREAVRRLLREPGYREKAKAMRVRMLRCDAATDGAKLIERLAASREPIFRAGIKVPV